MKYRFLSIALVLSISAGVTACGHSGYAKYSSFGAPFAQGDAACNDAAPKIVDISLYAQCMRLRGY
jgi:hypothetical protein